MCEAAVWLLKTVVFLCLLKRQICNLRKIKERKGQKYYLLLIFHKLFVWYLGFSCHYFGATGKLQVMVVYFFCYCYVVRFLSICKFPNGAKTLKNIKKRIFLENHVIPYAVRQRRGFLWDSVYERWTKCWEFWRVFICALLVYLMSPVRAAFLCDVTQWRRSVNLLPSDTFRLRMLPNLIHTTRPCSTRCSNHRMLLVVLW